MEWNVSSIERKCKTCYHYKLIENPHLKQLLGSCGECRKNAPVPIGLHQVFNVPADMLLAKWPIVREEDVCDEWWCNDEVWEKFEEEYYSIPLFKRIWFALTLKKGA